jgi:hypothetical protein
MYADDAYPKVLPIDDLLAPQTHNIVLPMVKLNWTVEIILDFHFLV